MAMQPARLLPPRLVQRLLACPPAAPATLLTGTKTCPRNGSTAIEWEPMAEEGLVSSLPEPSTTPTLGVTAVDGGTVLDCGLCSFPSARKYWLSPGLYQTS